MKKFTVALLILVLTGVILYFLAMNRPSSESSSEISGAVSNISLPSNVMKLTSSAFVHNQNVPLKYTCDGANVSPPLMIEDVPEGTQSFALIVHDPDAPTGDWLHWTVWNIAPETREIPEGSVPNGGMQGVTDFGNVGYGGPCPPSGTHRYFHEIYALDTMIDLASGANLNALNNAMEGHVLAKADLIGLYQRQ